MEKIDVSRATNPSKWPRWPWLPLKRRKRDGTTGWECAVLHADSDPSSKPIKVWAVNVFEADCWFPRPEWQVAAEYPDWDAFSTSDWIVD